MAPKPSFQDGHPDMAIRTYRNFDTKERSMRALPVPPFGLRKVAMAGLCAELSVFNRPGSRRRPRLQDSRLGGAHDAFAARADRARRTVRNSSQLAAIIESGPQPAPIDMIDLKNHPMAEACLFPEGRVTIAFHIGGCARDRLDMSLRDIPGLISGTTGEGI